jgi:REP element-mobilizing transposase RayT
VEVVSTVQEIDCAKESTSEKDFFYGFFKLLSRIPTDGEKFSFNNDSASAKGAAQAKLIILQKTLKGAYVDVSNFLPDFLFNEKRARRLDMECSAIATSQKSNLHQLPNCIIQLVHMWLKFEAGGRWSTLALTYKVSTPLILEGLHRTKIEKLKGKDIVRTKKPKRPSKRIEVLCNAEREILLKDENVFEDYKSYLKKLDKDVDIDKIKLQRDHIKDLITQMWTIVERYSAPLTKRRTILVAHLNEAQRKKMDFNKAFIQKHIDNEFADCKTHKSNLYVLSPIPILLKKNQAEWNRDIAMCDITLHYTLIPVSVQSIVRESLTEFANLTKSKIVTKRPIKKGKKGGILVEKFDEELPTEDPQVVDNSDNEEINYDD